MTEWLKVNGIINPKYVMHLLAVAESKPNIMYCHLSHQIESFSVLLLRSVDERLRDVVAKNTNYIFLVTGTRDENKNLDYHITSIFKN